MCILPIEFIDSVWVQSNYNNHPKIHKNIYIIHMETQSMFNSQRNMKKLILKKNHWVALYYTDSTGLLRSKQAVISIQIDM